jgi:uncharacterized protein YfkK (UPF0435 family)
MVNWEDELKQYIVKKFKENFNEEISIEKIQTVEIKVDEDLSSFDINELAYMYAFAMMKETFEEAKAISDEFAKRNCEIKFDIDDANKTGVINIYLRPETSVACIDIQMKILPDGVIIDFEKEDF